MGDGILCKPRLRLDSAPPDFHEGRWPRYFIYKFQSMTAFRDPHLLGLQMGRETMKPCLRPSPPANLPLSGTHNSSRCPGWLLSQRPVVPPGPFRPFLGALPSSS